MIDLNFVERLLDLLSRSDAETIEIRKWSTSIRVSKNSGAHVAAPAAYHVPSPPPVLVHSAAPVAPAAPAAAAVAAAAPVAEAAEAAAKPAGNLVDVKAPMVGTFYVQAEPGADPFVRLGDRIAVGRTLCIIEAMKIMNPFEAEVSGLIKEICVPDATPVEFGQVLFRVDPNG